MRIVGCVGDLSSRVEHIGSTAVPGLAAKPTLDVDILLAGGDDLGEVIARLEQLGYRHEGKLGIEGREAFAPPTDMPYHHLYVCVPDSKEFTRHIAFRDYLRTHPEAAREYAELKKHLAAKFLHDRKRYAEGKRTFIETALLRAVRDPGSRPDCSISGP